MARWLKDEAGNAAIEFILIAPLLLLILAGILEFGRVLNTWVIVNNAAREGARIGTLAWPESEIAPSAQQATLAYLNLGLAGRADIAGTSVAPPAVTNDAVTVTAEADVALYTPLVQSLVPSPLPVRASMTMRRQR